MLITYTKKGSKNTPQNHKKKNKILKRIAVLESHIFFSFIS